MCCGTIELGHQTTTAQLVNVSFPQNNKCHMSMIKTFCRRHCAITMIDIQRSLMNIYTKRLLDSLSLTLPRFNLSRGDSGTGQGEGVVQALVGLAARQLKPVVLEQLLGRVGNHQAGLLSAGNLS